MKNQLLKKLVQYSSLFAFVFSLVITSSNAQTGVGYYINPVLPGDHPDQTLMRVGNDFYSAGSSFHYSPFLPIHHSKDLVNWEVISRIVPANWSGLQSDMPSDGTWQGALAQFGGYFWCYFSNHTGGGQYFCKATSMSGPWSAPTRVSGSGVTGYDNSVFVDDDGTPYLVMKNGANVNRILKLDKTTGHSTGTVINMDWLNPASSNNPYGMAEGPVMCKRNGRYYYFFAGDVYGRQWVISSASLTGTQSSWTTPVAFFKSPGGTASTFKGPNHISQPIKLDDGTWWCLSHAYENNGTDYSAQGGRQGHLHQVFWDSNNVPYAYNPSGDPVAAPALSDGGIDWFVPSSDNFSSTTINPDWHFFRKDDGTQWSLTDRPGYMRIKPGSTTKDICKKDMHRFYNITTMVDFDATASNHEAGIRILSGNNDLTIKLCTGFNGSKKIKFYFGTTSYEANNTIGTKVWLKMERKGQNMSGYFSADGMAWTKIGSDINVSSLDKSQPNYNQWVGNSIAIYASNKTADFDVFMFRDGFWAQRAEGYVSMNGVSKVSRTVGTVVTNINEGDWIMLPGLDLGTQNAVATGVTINAAGTASGSVEVWQGNIGTSGKLLGTVAISSTGGTSTWKDFSTTVNSSGQQDIYLNFKGSGSLFEVNTIKFTSGVVSMPSVALTTPVNNATFTAPATIDLTATATDQDGTVSKVEFYDGTTKLGEDASSPYTYSWTNVAAGSYTLTAIATDNSGNKSTSTEVVIKVNVPQGPYSGTPLPIPGIIQLEEFDLGGNGVAYLDNTPGREVTPVVNYRTNEDVDIETCTDAGGGYNIGYATAGEWLEYTVNVQATGNYDIDFRVAANGDGRTVSLTLGSTTIASNVAIPNTAGWQTWTTTTVKNVPLTAGQNVLRLTIGTSDYVNLNYLQFKNSIVTGLENVDHSGVGFYPNPFGGDGLIIHKNGEFKYQITDIRGLVVEKGNGKDQQSVGVQLYPGVYILSVENAQGIMVQKVVRQ